MIDIFGVFNPVLRCLDPETAHRLTIGGLRFSVFPMVKSEDAPSLRSRVMGLDFPNPVGLAAGFDKHAEVTDALLSLGFGFVEVGSITPRPQSGNPKPRVFRLPEDKAIINRYGFNSCGIKVAINRLKNRKKGIGIVGVNLGANKDSNDPASDYVIGISKLTNLAGYFVINVSSPNTPGLRSLQKQGSLARLLDLVMTTRESLRPPFPAPILVKVAPDLDIENQAELVEVCVRYGVDGLIIGNTTVTRPSLNSSHKNEEGGLSGRPLFDLSTYRLSQIHGLAQGRLALVGCGGIASGRDAYLKIRAGANLIQLYTGLVYEGPQLIKKIKKELVNFLLEDGYSNISQAVGVDAGKY